jgi:hypothetical protein
MTTVIVMWNRFHHFTNLCFIYRVLILCKNYYLQSLLTRSTHKTQKNFTMK